MRFLKRNLGCDDVEKDGKGDTADRATEFTEQWAALESTGLYWAVLSGTGLYWRVLGCSRLYWAVLGCPGGLGGSVDPGGPSGLGGQGNPATGVSNRCAEVLF